MLGSIATSIFQIVFGSKKFQEDLYIIKLINWIVFKQMWRRVPVDYTRVWKNKKVTRQLYQLNAALS